MNVIVLVDGFKNCGDRNNPNAIVWTPESALSGTSSVGAPLCGTNVIVFRLASGNDDLKPAGRTMGGSVRATNWRAFSSQVVALMVVKREAATMVPGGAG